MVRVTGTVNNYKEGAAGSYSTALCIHVPRSRIARRDMLDAFSRGTTAQRPASRARSPPDLGTGGMQGWAETDGGGAADVLHECGLGRPSDCVIPIALHMSTPPPVLYLKRTVEPVQERPRPRFRRSPMRVHPF